MLRLWISISHLLALVVHAPSSFSLLSTSLFDYPIRPRQHVCRNREMDLLCRFQVNNQLELCWLFNGQVSGLCALQYFIDIDGRPTEQFVRLRSITHESTVVGKFMLPIHHRQA